MPLDPELEAIFNVDPRFREVLADYERRGTSDPRNPDSFKVAEVTDEALSEYIKSGFPSLAPVIDRRDSQRFVPGQSAPPPVGGTEDEAGALQPEQPVTEPSGSGEEAGTGVSERGPSPDSGAQPTTPTGEEQTPEQIAAQAAADQLRQQQIVEEANLERLRQQAAAQQQAGTQEPFRPAGQLPEVDPQELETYRALDSIINQDPRLQQILVQYLQTGQVDPQLLVGQQQQPLAPQPPADLDLTDPAVRQLWDQHVATIQQQRALEARTQQQFAELSQRFEAQQQSFAQRTQAENDLLVERVRTSFARQHNLDDAEAARIESVAANLGVLAHLVQGRDPITGRPAPGDPASLVERAFEIAYAVDPLAQERQRQAVLAAEQARVREDQQRRQRLAGVAGGSGAQSRTPPAPRTAEERRDAMVAEIGQHMYGPQGE